MNQMSNAFKTFRIILIVGVIAFVAAVFIITSNDVTINIVNTSDKTIKASIVDKKTNKETVKEISASSDSEISLDEGKFDIKLSDTDNKEIRKFSDVSLTKASGEEVFIDTNPNHVYYFLEFSDQYEGNNVKEEDLLMEKRESSDVMKIVNKNGFEFYSQFDAIPEYIKSKNKKRMVMLCPIPKEQHDKMTEDELKENLGKWLSR